MSLPLPEPASPYLLDEPDAPAEILDWSAVAEPAGVAVDLPAEELFPGIDGMAAILAGPDLEDRSVPPEAASAPSFALPAEELFPSIDEMAAILAESMAPTPGPDLETRQEMAEFLGLDPSVALDPAAYEAALIIAPGLDEDAALDAWTGDGDAFLAGAETVLEDWPVG